MNVCATTAWMRWRVLVLARAVLAGWVTLLLAVYLVERPVLLLTARLLGGTWLPIVRLIFECGAMATTGWVTGRLSRPNPVFAALVLAAMLTFWDFGNALDIQVPWLLRLAADAVRDPRYSAGLVDLVVTHVFLFGSLIAGALLSRGRQTPLSIVPPQ